MRKTILRTLATVIVLSVCATTAFAAGLGGGRYFVDADGDGVCDICGANYGTCLTGTGTAFIDTNQDGICDNCGIYHWCSMAGTVRGRNFVDADGDGICDNHIFGQNRGGYGCCGFRGGRGR